MAQFKAYEPGVEVVGDAVLAFVNAMGPFKGIALGILKDNGISDPQTHLWYSQQAWLDAFRTIAREVGPNTLYQIGRQIPIQGRYPPGQQTIEEVFEQLDTAYKQSHRGGEVGFYRYDPLGLRTGRVVCFTPYPCDFDRGLIHSLAERFAPSDALLDVRHVRPGPCKEEGAEHCDYQVSW